ncbi:pentapeptide repeat-containing protein, partial [Acinetobacter baumannii]
ISGSNFTKASFVRAVLDRAQFGSVAIRTPEGDATGRRWPTLLSDADFTEASLAGSFLRDANCAGARFLRANMTGADMIGCVLDGAQF